VEVVITNVSYPIKPLKEVSGVVSSIRTGTSSTNNSIPSGGLVLSANGTNATTLLARMTVGDRVYLKTSISKSSFYWSNFALSGNGYLLRAGLPVDTGTTADPQTALGWNSTNLFMVTVDGRSAASIGMSWNTLASFLLNTVGATDAIALDGGGSTTMLINGQGVVNVPSDGSERAVADAVMLVNQPTSSTFPLQDDFTSAGRTLKWDDKLKYSAVSSFSPAAPGGDGYAMTVKTTTSGADSARVGDLGDTNYTVEAQIYCEYRAAIAGNGYERCGIFARDNGNQAFTSTANKGNCYALIYKTDTGQILPCKVIDGIITDFLAPNPIYLTTSDWHKFTIRCYGSRIQYFLDGAVICTVTDTTFERGYCGIGYHSLYSSNGNIHGTRADYFKAFVLTNLAPFAVSDTTNTLEDASVTISPLVNDSDADADTLTIVSVSATNGSAIILGTNIVLTPNTNFNGTATIGYKVSDGRGGTNSAVITVTVNSVNDAPVALNDTTNVLEDVAVTIHPLANDNDVDGDLLTIVSASAMNGNAIISGTDIVLTPDTNFNGTATIGYTISDGHGGTNNAVITVTVNPVNDVPIAVDDTTNTLQGVSVSINPLVNDTDVEGDTLTIVSVSATNGSAIISGTNILLTPDANFNGTATIGYKISDGHGGTNSAAISVIVSGIPGPATLAIHLDAAQYASLSITGSIGSTYRIEFATQIPSSNWTSLTNIFLPTSPYFYLDTGGGTNYLHRFYRAVSVE